MTIDLNDPTTAVAVLVVCLLIAAAVIVFGMLSRG